MNQIRPNILWICTDEQRADSLGCYGNSFVHTPNLDRLAQNGTLFERAYIQSPVCTPSRSSFLSGRYPRTTRNRQNGQPIRPEEVLLPKIFREHGYYTGLIGKLHLSPCDPEVSPDGEPRIDDGYIEFHWSNSPNPKWQNNQYSRWLWEKGEEFATHPFESCQYVQSGMPADLHLTKWVVDTSVQFINAASRFDRPWMLSVNFTDPHFPLDPPDEYLERYLEKLDEIPLPNYVTGELSHKPLVQQSDHQAATNQPGRFPYAEMTDEDQRFIRAAYWAMVDQIDFQVGRLINFLEKTNQLENTLIIFMSDHGDMLGDHGIHLKGPYFYEGLVRVPLLLSGPGIRPGTRSQALIEMVDLAPTLLDAAHLPHHPGMQGKSFYPLLTGDILADQHREDIYAESYNATWRTWDRSPGEEISHYKSKEDLVSQPFATMLRDSRYKLVVYHGETLGELYDLHTDPHETHNLWSDPDSQAIKLALMKRLCDRMAWTADPLPARISRW